MIDPFQKVLPAHHKRHRTGQADGTRLFGDCQAHGAAGVGQHPGAVRALLALFVTRVRRQPQYAVVPLGGLGAVNCGIAADGNKKHIGTCHVFRLLGARGVSKVAEMTDPDVFHLDDERYAFAAFGALLTIVVGTNAGDERPMDFILAWPVKDDRTAGNGFRVAVVFVPVADGNDISGRLADRIAGHGRARVRDDSGLASADAKAGVTQPDDFHALAAPQTGRRFEQSSAYGERR